ncbi:putative protease [Lachnospiraceae bacterium RM5]|nr:putative protease [Lachnospiraceae bacterium RM5]
MSHVELLSPAGSKESLYYALKAGADAVYMGGESFGARAYAKNPDNNEILDVMDYTHILGKKMYLTVNTLLKNDEIKNDLYHYIKPIYENGIDAVLVQDVGVLKFLKEEFKNLEIHASTQMTVCNKESAEFLKGLGLTRVVTARELSLKEVKSIIDNVDIEVECFIHGAMCYSYSGMCLFSSIIGGRSGNRGRCAGPCRQPYDVFMDGKIISDKNTMYPLSMKDMNTLKNLPDLLDAGISSLKIEGRMKSPDYAAYTTYVYKKYIDNYLENGRNNFEIKNNDLNKLNNLYTRINPTNGYYYSHNPKELITFKKPSYNMGNEDEIKKIHDEFCGEIKKHDACCFLELKKDTKAVLTITSLDGLTSISITGEKVSEALNKPITRENVLKQLNKTGNTYINFTDIYIDMDNDIFMPLSMLNNLRRDAIKAYFDKLLSGYKLKYQSDDKEKTDNNTYDQRKDLIQKNNTEYNSDTNNDYINNKEKNNLSVMITKKEQSDAVLNFSEISDVYISSDNFSLEVLYEIYKKIENSGKNPYIVLPYIYRENNKKYINDIVLNIPANKILVRNIDEFSLMVNQNKKGFLTDSSFYVFNDYAKDFINDYDVKRFTLPYELNFRELKDLSDSKSELIVYGKIPLMISAGCVNKNYFKCDGKLKNISIKDRKNMSFDVMNFCNHCYNVIFNSVPLSLTGVKDKVDELNINNFRINLTTESYHDSLNILEKYIKVFYYSECQDELKDFTRGHFKRGIL